MNVRLKKKCLRQQYLETEVLLRQGIPLPEIAKNEISKLMNRIDGFKAKDFKVKLGSVLEGDIRKY